MIRFPNPKSNLISLRKVFNEAVICSFDLKKGPISHDDIGRVAAEKGLISSSGYIGEQAIEKSFNRDRSLDRIYNQVKMLTELYRMLGWVLPFYSKGRIHKGQFVISPLGLQVREFTGESFDRIRKNGSTLHEQDLFEWNLLNICFPHPHTDSKTSQRQRTFAFLLKFALSLGGYLSRDELEVALQLQNDRNNSEVEKCFLKVQRFREGKNGIHSYFERISQMLKIQKNTIDNYTRFPLGACVDIGWFQKKTFTELPDGIREIYKRQFGKQASRMAFFFVTDYGRKAFEKATNLIDLRMEDLNGYDNEQLVSLVALILHEQRSVLPSETELDFLLPGAQIVKRFNKEFNFVVNQPVKTNLLFEPFQQLSSPILSYIMEKLYEMG